MTSWKKPWIRVQGNLKLIRVLIILKLSTGGSKEPQTSITRSQKKAHRKSWNKIKSGTQRKTKSLFLMSFQIKLLKTLSKEAAPSQKRAKLIIFIAWNLIWSLNNMPSLLSKLMRNLMLHHKRDFQHSIWISKNNRPKSQPKLSQNSNWWKRNLFQLWKYRRSSPRQLNQVLLF